MNLVKLISSVISDYMKTSSVCAQKCSAEEAEAAAESVRKKLKTGREKLDHTQRELNVAEDIVTPTSQSEDRLYVVTVSCFSCSLMLF